MYRFAVLLISLFVISCSSNTAKEAEPVVEKPVMKEPVEPQCLPGCAPNEDDKCVTFANVSDGSTVESQEIECEAVCCTRQISGPGQDADSDGVLDDSDQCPTEAEDFDNFQDKDGCPDPDNDQDKIPDVDDLCAEDAEDMDGFQDDDGCPD